MIIGYARVSTNEQNLDRQIDMLKEAGAEKIFEEKITGTRKDRPELEKMLEQLRKDDIVIVEDLSNVVCYPNPARDGYINITNLPTDLTDFSLEIFTVTSKLVRAFSEDDTESDSKGIRKIKWDCKNDSGEKVAPGVYIVLIKNDSKIKKCKIAIIR